MANYIENGLDKLLKKDLISIILSQKRKILQRTIYELFYKLLVYYTR